MHCTGQTIRNLDLFGPIFQPLLQRVKTSDEYAQQRGTHLLYTRSHCSSPDVISNDVLTQRATQIMSVEIISGTCVM